MAFTPQDSQVFSWEQSGCHDLQVSQRETESHFGTVICSESQQVWSRAQSPLINWKCIKTFLFRQAVNRLTARMKQNDGGWCVGWGVYLRSFLGIVPAGQYLLLQIQPVYGWDLPVSYTGPVIWFWTECTNSNSLTRWHAERTWMKMLKCCDEAFLQMPHSLRPSPDKSQWFSSCSCTTDQTWWAWRGQDGWRWVPHR